MLIPEISLDLNSTQADVIASFLRATLEEDKNVYVEMHLVLCSKVSMENARFFVSRYLFMVCIRVLAPSGSIFSFEFMVYPMLFLITNR